MLNCLLIYMFIMCNIFVYRHAYEYASYKYIRKLPNSKGHVHLAYNKRMHGGWTQVSLAICRNVLWVCGASSWLNASSSTASMLAVVHAVIGLALPDFLVVDPLCFKRLKKSFNVLFFHSLAGNSLVSLTAS